ncbi:MAG: hypothetical protein ACI4RH_09110 [Huintestinicola sp.]
MDNYEAIMKMNRQQLADFLDDIYVTGLNNGMYAAAVDKEEAQDAVLGEFPYGEEWLASDAEAATLCEEAEDGDSYLLEACVKAVQRLAGIEE